MTERPSPSNPYGAYYRGESRDVPESTDEGLGAKKTMLVMVIVVGCFAILWPKLFYPMLVSNANSHIKPGPVDKAAGCCDVISELDVDTIKIMSELCSGTIITDEHDKLGGDINKDLLVVQCRRAVLETCGIDISAALQDRISLGHSAKQILEEVRSLNGSLCLKYNFGVSPWQLGVPHRVNVYLDPGIKQERPAHLRPGMVHPAFRERGRAIPEADGSMSVRRSSTPPRIVEGRPGPIPGMRPAMGGPGHVVPPPKQSNYGFMGVLMPIYTVGFVVFFSYTIMKLVFKKKPDPYVGAPLYPSCDTDDQFQKEVFEPNKHYFSRPNKDASKIVVNAVAALLEEVNQEIEAHKTKAPPSDVPNAQDDIRPNGSLRNEEEEEQGSVTVMGMETRASCESGKKWSRPHSPILPHPPPNKEPSPPPQQIFLEGTLPPQSQILVADSATETQKALEDDSPVVLAGKMTLSVISLDSEPGGTLEDSSSNSGKKSSSDEEEEERRRSGSNTSEEFEKINAADLEDQIDNIIEEAETIALTEENRFSLEEEIGAPQLNEKDILEEIKNQFNLEDDLMQALKEREPEGKVGLPVTDIIKEFLNDEEALEEVLTVEDNETDEGPINQENLAAENRSKEKGNAVKGQGDGETEEPCSNKPTSEGLEENIDERKIIEDQKDGVEEDKSDENNAKNMADVLLQGLLVKEEEEQSDKATKNDETLKQREEELPKEKKEEGVIEDAQDIEQAGRPSSGVEDVEEQVIDDVEFEDESEEEGEDPDEDELLRELDGESAGERMNGEDSSRNGAGNSETAAENDISDDELVNDDGEEIEEIIEYVDDTDDEGEEIVEINGNEHILLNENGAN